MTTKSMMVRVGADTTGMERGLKASEARMKKFSEQCKKIGRGMTVAGAAITGAVGLMIKGYVKAGDEVHKMALRTGFTTESLSELRYASQICGADLGALEKGVKKMSKTIVDASDGLTTYVRAFDRIGLKAEDLLKLSPEEQFDRIAVAIASVEDPTLRAATAQEIFGRAGTQLLPLFAAGEEGLEALRKKAHELGIVFDQEAADKAAVLNDSMTTLKASFKGVTMSIATTLIPVVTSIVEKVSEMVIRIKDWIKENPVLAGRIAKVVTIVGGLMAILGPLAMVLPGLVTGFTMLGGALTTLCGPAGLVIIAVAGIALALKDMVDTLKDAKEAMHDLVEEAFILSQGFMLFVKLGEAAKEAGGKLAEQWEEIIKEFRGGTKEFSKFRGDWQGLLKTIISDPNFAGLKVLLMDIANGVLQINLEGKDLSIQLPKHMQKVNEAAKTGGLAWISFGKDFAEFAKTVAVKVLTLKAMAKEPYDLGPAFTMPNFTLAGKEYETWGEYSKAFWAKIKDDAALAWQATLEGAKEVTSGLDSLFGQFHENEAMRIDNEEKKRTDAIESWYEREREKIEATITNEEEKVAALEALDEEKARKENKLQHDIDKEKRKLARKEAKAKKLTAMFSAGINVAEAITKALAQGGFLLGAIMSGVVAALGAIQIAAIAAAPLPALAKGGRIGMEGGIVGEKGAELFVPDRPGTIIPLNRGAGTGAFTFSPIVNIYAKTLDDYAINHAAEKIFAAMDRERRRRGY